MELKKIRREHFWDNSGNPDKEMCEFRETIEVVQDAEWTMGDSFLTLFCC